MNSKYFMFIWALINTFHVKSAWDLHGAEKYPSQRAQLGLENPLGDSMPNQKNSGKFPGVPSDLIIFPHNVAA